MHELLNEAGNLLYGDRWQSLLARDLAVSDRTIRRWAAGTHEIPRNIWHEIDDLLNTRIAEITRFQIELQASI